MIDLHCHSKYSDGLLTPHALITKALENDVKTLALTDHDTVAGLDDLHKAAEGKPIRIIDGIELSTRFKLVDIHILGLNIDRKNEALLQLIQRQEEARRVRAQQISEKLKALKIDDAYQQVVDIVGHERIGRPHYAKLLLDLGLVKDLQDAFKRYLGRGKLAYVPTVWNSIEDVVSGIVQAGGCAVIAHPFKYVLTRTKLHALIIAFKLAGGKGIEVISGMMTPALILDAAALCQRFQLLASTGSDYHGTGISRVDLGKQAALPETCIPIWEHL